MSETGRLLGIDYGHVRIGLAVSDPDRKFSFPLVIRTREDKDAEAEFFRATVEEEQIVAFVVGLPIHLSGEESQKSSEARQFGAWLTSVTGLAVTYWDERFSTVEAESALWNAGLTHKRRKERRDKVAAQILLQAYLDAGCPEDPKAGPLDS